MAQDREKTGVTIHRRVFSALRSVRNRRLQVVMRFAAIVTAGLVILLAASCDEPGTSSPPANAPTEGPIATPNLASPPVVDSPIVGSTSSQLFPQQLSRAISIPTAALVATATTKPTPINTNTPIPTVTPIHTPQPTLTPVVHETSLRGRLLHNRDAISARTSEIPRFAIKVRASSQSCDDVANDPWGAVVADFDTSTAEYGISSLKAGSYCLRTTIDAAAPFDASENFPGDFVSIDGNGASFDLLKGQTTDLDINFA